MTRNQIEYWKLKHEEKASARTARIQRRYNDQMVSETKRANLARERETNRANTINFALQAKRDEAQKNHWDWSRAETAAHNRETERIQSATQMANQAYQERQSVLDESRVALGYYQSASALEGQKYAAGASYANVAMMDRANVARQAEINRANLINESLQAQAQDTAERNSWTNRLNAQSNMTDSATRARQQVLEERKWNTAYLPKATAEIELLGQQAQTQTAQRDRWNEQSHVERVNAFTNVLGSIGSIVSKGVISSGRK